MRTLCDKAAARLGRMSADVGRNDPHLLEAGFLRDSVCHPSVRTKLGLQIDISNIFSQTRLIRVGSYLDFLVGLLPRLGNGKPRPDLARVPLSSLTGSG